MKNTLLIALLTLASAGAIAANGGSGNACTNSPTAGNGTGVTGNTNNFVAVSFTPKCSANTYVSYVDGGVGTYFAVGAASSKGQNSFNGSTAGGGVVPAIKCAATPCVQSDASNAASSAPTS